jgi:hypothetical protein
MKPVHEQEAYGMKRDLHAPVTAGSLLLALSSAGTASAQKHGGILKMGHFDSPASMSPLEESTQAVNRPMSGVFNNLVMFDQHVPLPASENLHNTGHQGCALRNEELITHTFSPSSGRPHSIGFSG